MLNNKLIVPVALGFSLVTVTAILVYYIFKKEEDETEPKSEVKTSRMNVIEMKVPKSILPALIGRGGSNIKDIERKSDARIQVKKFNDQDYDVMIIRGQTATTQLAETLINEFIRNQPVIEEGTMEVPVWACGRIIGSGGSNINDISHRSGARVKLESHSGVDSATSRLVTFRGTTKQIQLAKELVENSVSQEKCRREIDQSKRSPRHAHSSTSTIDTPADLTGDVKHVTHSEAAGSAIEVYVSAVSSPARFWVQFVGPQVARLDELVEVMTDYYNNKDNRNTHALTQVGIGQIVAAVFRHDCRWYRAKVCDIRPNEFDSTQQVADVFYLDYGDSEYVATHELCELRPDLLRLRFQAMECFLAGVCPKGKAAMDNTGRWDKWPSEAIERFEELTQVARWKPLVSKTCNYKKCVTVEGDKEREIPGIKLYDVTEHGEVDIGGTLISEGWAEESHPPPPTHPTPTPFGDLGNSRILGMLAGHGERASSLPRDNSPGHSPVSTNPTSTSLAAGLELTGNPINLSYPTKTDTNTKVNGSHNLFLDTERHSHDTERHSSDTEPHSDTASSETLVPSPSPKLGKLQLNELKANMNRIDSHHGNLESLGRHIEHNNNL